MGQKVHPIGMRLGIVKDWSSTWYAERAEYADNLNNDIAVRSLIRKKLGHASVSRIYIERPAKNARIVIHTARPGIVIGKKGEDIEALRLELSGMMGIPVSHQRGGNTETGAGCVSGCGKRRKPTGATYNVPQGNAACSHQRHAAGG